MAQAHVVEGTPSPPENGVSLTTYLEASDQHPVEVVDGEIIVMSPSQRRHNRIAHLLYDSLRDFLKSNRLGVVLMEAAYVLDGDKRADWVKGARLPDVSFIAQKRVEAHDAEHGPDEGPWWLAPDLAVEIVSPTDSYTDVTRKVSDYLRFGVQQIWVIDPQANALRVYTPEKPNGMLLEADELITCASVLPGWQMSVREIFEA
jgi:Uma2 family endonuclease